MILLSTSESVESTPPDLVGRTHSEHKDLLHFSSQILKKDSRVQRVIQSPPRAPEIFRVRKIS